MIARGDSEGVLGCDEGLTRAVKAAGCTATAGTVEKSELDCPVWFAKVVETDAEIDAAAAGVRMAVVFVFVMIGNHVVVDLTVVVIEVVTLTGVPADFGMNLDQNHSAIEVGETLVIEIGIETVVVAAVAMVIYTAATGLAQL